ncbi:MAG: addiction module toxin, HicA family [Acidobacteria bacterium]|nr:addiction module toxin, HicA family [Acidobacteriota bacterium]MXZ71464.1 addiction module toxin, HicA family [Acidobacteriota bacterium]MYD70444.1 addiction module toxin, HicA family [Acidobacteriota bacterium]MYJ06048.1 addiction module toxin, HicA family [Acidobacteriota bacterium]
MARLPVISGDQFLKVVAQVGFELDRTEGSHMILVGPTGRRLTVPKHRELGRGLLRALIRDAGLSREEFVNLLRPRAH